MRKRTMAGMDGRKLRAGGRAVCLDLPRREPCSVRILSFEDDGKVLVSNGRMVKAVDPASCIPRD